MRRIGILGGMGPEATILLMHKIVSATSAQDDADHIPLIVDQNTQVPSRIRHLVEGSGPSPAPALVEMAQRLQTAGAEALAMACNTAHHFAPEIRASVQIPFLDMVALSADRAALVARDAPVGILASPAVRVVGLFDAALAKAGLKTVYPRDEEAMLAAIRSIKSKGPSDAARAALAAGSADLMGQGAVVQLIACTEFSLVAEAVPKEVTAIDTLDELVDAVVAFAKTGLIGQERATGKSQQ